MDWANIAAWVLAVAGPASAEELGQSRGMPVPYPREAYEQLPATPKAVKKGVVFVEFDLQSLTASTFDDSLTNSSQIYGGELVPYGDDVTRRAALMEAVRIDWQAYDVEIVDVRPSSGTYTMNVMTGTNFMGPGVLGVAPLDCNDTMTHSNITFAFHTANDGFPATTQATTVSQEVAHSYGLEHVDDPTDIMNPANAGGDPTFKDECIPTVAGGLCPDQHVASCGDALTQNSHQELLAIFGTSAPDTMKPTVTITSPANGAEFDVGAEFVIEATAADDRTVVQLRLFDDDEPLQARSQPPYTWEVFDIPEGYYRFQVVAIDAAGNEAESNVVELLVGDAEIPPDEEADDDGEDADESGSDAAMNDDGGGGHGCGCRADRPYAAAWPLVAIVIFSRRRRITPARA